MTLSGFDFFCGDAIATRQTKMKSKFMLKISGVALISVLGILIYSTTFRSPFMFDDETYIVENDSIKNVRVITNDILGNADSQISVLEEHKKRIVVFLTFALNYHYGQDNVFGYHCVNMIIHIYTIYMKKMNKVLP